MKVTQKSFSIAETLKMIKNQIGLDLNLCDHFTGMQEHDGKKYFNIVLGQKTSESQEYASLLQFADRYQLISIEPNGVRRVAIFEV